MTEKKTAELAMAEALKLCDEFLSIASHELKTPLTSLKINTQFQQRLMKSGAADAFSPERVTKFVNSNEKTVSRIGKLVDDMLDLSRIQLGKLGIQKEKFDLAKLSREVIERMELQTFQQIKFSGPEELIILADPMRVEQVLVNLLSNAIKYGEGKPIEVTLEKQVRVSVSYQGPGVRAEDQEKIFFRFERANSDKNISGFGIGLFISKEIVEAHAGKIGMISKLGNGSTFWFQIP